MSLVQPATKQLLSSSLTERIAELIRGHRQLDGWTAYSGTDLTRVGAAVYAQQHGIFTRHSRRVWAYVVGNCPEVDMRRFIVRENLHEEEGTEENSHYEKIVRLGAVLGLERATIDDAVPLASTRAALLIWETLTKDRHWLIGAAAKGALEYRNTSGLEGQRWMQKLGLSRDQVEFWMLHHEVDQVHGDGAFDLIARFVPNSREVDENAVLTAVDDSMYAWRLFRGGIAEAARAAK